MARLKDIAARTGLSVNTVSLALRDSPRIPPDTRSRIREVAEALDYTPNFAAQVLHTQQTMTVGLLIPDITNPLLARVAHCTEQELRRFGYVTLLASATELETEERRALNTFRARQVDGILMFPANHGRLDDVRRLRAGGMPVVLMAGEDAAGLDVVCMDEYDGARRATEHMIAAGHRRIGLVDNSDVTRANPAKRNGYRAALAEAGLPDLPELVVPPSGDSAQAGYAALGRMMAGPVPPTAVLIGDDRLALGGLHWCQVHGLAVPGDLAVFGYDNIEYSAFSAPPLSSVDNPSEDLAQMAVARLLMLIASRDAMPPPEVLRIPPELVLRASTGLPKARKD